MSVNKHRPHVFVLPEDDANHAIATGFLLHPKLDLRSIQILPNVGGWIKVRDQFQSEHVRLMETYKNRHLIMLLDFDEKKNRREEITNDIPSHLLDRVFVMGVWSEPEELKKAGLGPLEKLGTQLACECENDTRETWNHALLRHNNFELERMALKIRTFLFPTH